VNLEASIASGLRAILAPLPVGAKIESTEEFRHALGLLEGYIPEVLRELHPEWKYESLDGILPAIAHKPAQYEIELAGECILISDQTLVPIHLRIQLAADKDEICWLECRLGERVDRVMKRVPYKWSYAIGRTLDATAGVRELDWFYAVTFGQRWDS
jgi:hypothetical protein